MRMPLTIGSLFSGIGGLELGLERAGLGPVLWQAESDPYCRRVLAKHWPEAKRYEDVRDINGTAARPDIICGGFPCQDISNAGKRAGMAGERSGLWREYARIIRELRPRIVVVENVAALLARGLGDVLGDLAACGYDAQWDCVPAAAVGAPHRRDRLFVIAYSNGEHSGVQPGRGSGQSRTDSTKPTDDGSAEPVADAFVERCEALHHAVADAHNAGRQQQRRPEPAAPKVATTECGSAAVPYPDSSRERQSQGGKSDLRRRPCNGGQGGIGNHWSVEPDVGRVADGVPARAHRLRALGNAVVPQVAEVIGRLVIEKAADL